MRFWIIYFLIQILLLWVCLGRLSQCSLKSFSRRPTMVTYSPTPSPTIKKFLMVLLLLVNKIQFLFPLEICFWRYKICFWRYISSCMPPMITFSLIIHFRILSMTLRTFEIEIFEILVGEDNFTLKFLYVYLLWFSTFISQANLNSS